MRIIERAKAHFKSLQTKAIEVPEWGDENGPLIIYAEPFTLKDKAKLQAVTRLGNSEADTLVELLVMKCLNKDGEKIFTIEDKTILRNMVDASVLERVSTEIMKVDFKELEKN